MNIFAFDPDPAKCARWLDNKRVGKLMMECSQMLSVAILEHCPDATKRVGMGGLCKPSHQNHPVAVWVRECSGNFQWTLEYARALRDEYAHRYNGVIHGTAQRFPEIESWDWVLPEGDRTEFQNSARHGELGLDFTDMPVCDAYRAYINARWGMATDPPAWHKRSAPSWYEPVERKNAARLRA